MARTNPPVPVKKTVPRSALKRVTALAATGAREVDLARAVGVGFRCWKRMLDDDAELREAYEAGRAAEHDALRGALFKAAMEGQVVPAIFLLKARFGYRDRPDDAGDTGGRVTVEFKIPGALDDAQYRAHITGAVVPPEGDSRE